MAKQWFVLQGDRELGPFSSNDLKSLAESGRIQRDTNVRLGDSVWVPASRVTGLPFPPETSLAIATVVATARTCPFCAETIAEQAVKCRHCGEFLDATLRAAAKHDARPFIAPTPVVRIPTKRWEPGVAALLSFIFPGAGQIYKGQPLNGVAWFFVTLLAYICFVVPGLLMHVCCIAGAASGDPYKQNS